MIHIYLIVEGHGDEKAFPLLIRRVFSETLLRHDVGISPPFRLPKDRIMRKSFLERALTLADLKLNELVGSEDSGAIIITRDSDAECPVSISAEISRMLSDIHTNHPTYCAVCTQEFEAWFLQPTADFRSHRDCNPTFPVVDNPDLITSPKSHFERLFLQPGRIYSETTDQPKFTSYIELHQPKSRSLQHLIKTLTALST